MFFADGLMILADTDRLPVCSANQKQPYRDTDA